MTKVKICGITDRKTALYAAEMGADALGFVFAPSKRKIEPANAAKIIRILPEKVEKVGVFVNESIEKIQHIAETCGLTMIQLHGEEQVVMYQKLKYPLIKAVGIGSEEDIERAKKLDAPYVLMDHPKGQKYYGGNGLSFDWQLIKGRFEGKKLILAGGLNSENVKEAIELLDPYMVDVSSGVETDGVKDLNKIDVFIQRAKGAKTR